MCAFFPKERPFSEPLYHSPFAVGAIAGAAESTLYPLVVWRINLQKKAVSSRSLPTWQFKDLYKGYSFFAACNVPLFTLIVGLNAEFKNHFSSLVSASLAGMSSTALNIPEAALVRRREDQVTSLFKSAQVLYKESGLKGLMRGGSFQCCRNTAYSVALNDLTPRFAKAVKASFPNTTNSTVQVASAFFAGLLAGVVSQPIDWGNAQSKMRVGGNYRSVGEVFMKMLATNKMELFTGVLPRCLKTSFGSAIVTWVVMKAKGEV